MVAVSTVDGIKYGFTLLGYLLGVVVAGGLLILIGSGFSPGPYRNGNPILVMVFVLAGLAVIYAGGLGMLYKVIADGVQVGTVAADRGGPVDRQTLGPGRSAAGHASVGQPLQSDYRRSPGERADEGEPDGQGDLGGRDQVVDERSGAVDADDRDER